MGQDLLECRGRERLNAQKSRLASIKRLFPILEDFHHQRVDAAADHKIESNLVVETVPESLQITIDGGIDAEELLEFVDEDSQWLPFGQFHQLAEESAQGGYLYADRLWIKTVDLFNERGDQH